MIVEPQIFVFWTVRRNWIRVFKLHDQGFVFLTLRLVVSLLVMVFLSRVVYGFGASDIANGWVSAPIQLDYETREGHFRLMLIMLGVS